MTDGWVGEVVRAPDLIGPLVGYRTWTVAFHDGVPQLASVLHQTVHWPSAAELRAQHLGGGGLRDPHEAPISGCQCGIYAWDTAEHLMNRGGGAWLGHRTADPPSILAPFRFLGNRQPGPRTQDVLSGMDIKVAGRVALWGRVYRHTYGFRAEFARPTGLVAPSGGSRALVEALANGYRLDLLPSLEAA